MSDAPKAAETASGRDFFASRVSRALKPAAQAFDEIRIRTVPRYKTSGLSGDEWRISAVTEFWRKGRKVYEVGRGNIEYACRLLDADYIKATEGALGFFAGEGDVCDQEGCADPATVTYRLKARYCREGHKSEPLGIQIRRFCDKHKKRGDCGLDDADANYELME